MARGYDFTHLDVFGDGIFTGNPLAVFPDAQGLSEQEMQSLARELNLSETTFVLPPTSRAADYRVRIFTPAKEIPYAGHPSVGTAWLLAQRGRLGPLATKRVHQEVKAGILPIDLETDAAGQLARVFTVQAKPLFDPPVDDRIRVARALGLSASDLHPTLPVQKVSTGLPWLLVPLQDVDALDRVQLDLGAFRGDQAIHHDVYPFALAPAEPGADVESRGFPTFEFEDPATGSASGCLGAYLAKHRVIKGVGGRVAFVNAQGRHLHRPSRIRVEVRIDPSGHPTEVRVGGRAKEVYSSRIVLDA